MGNSTAQSWQQAFSDMIYWKWQGEPSAPSVSSTIGFIEGAAQLQPGDRVLDLGCALGHYSLELARRGYRVTGLDYSQVFLEETVRRAAAAGVGVDFVQGDMTRLGFAEQFDAVMLWGYTFGIFSDEENCNVLAGIARALAPGGRAIIDTQNHSSLGDNGPKDWYFDSDDPNLLFLTEDTADVPAGRSGFDVLAIDVTAGKRHLMSFSWQLYLAPQLRKLLEQAGLQVLGIYGDDPAQVDWSSYESGAPYPYATAAFTNASEKRIWLCRK